MNFISPVEAVDRIWIEKMPSSKPVKVARAVRCGRVVLMQAENGRLYSDRAEQVCYVPGDFNHHADWFGALKALGVITAKQVAAHKAACDRRDAARKQRYAADDLAKAAKVAGLPLTKAQQAFVAKHGTKREGASA